MGRQNGIGINKAIVAIVNEPFPAAIFSIDKL